MICFNINLYLYNCEGKSLNFYIGPEAPFINENASEEEQMTGEVSK